VLGFSLSFFSSIGSGYSELHAIMASKVDPIAKNDNHKRNIDMLRFFHSTWKRQAMVCLIAQSFFLFSFGEGKSSAQNRLFLEKENLSEQGASTVVYRLAGVNLKDACTQSIARAVEKIEKKQGWKLYPSEIKKVAIVLDISSAPGIKVRPVVLESLIKFLKFRFYTNKDIQIVTTQSSPFMLSNQFGYPRLSGFEILHPDISGYYNQSWFYESSMPASKIDRAKLFNQYPLNPDQRLVEERKSFLPSCLFDENVFWINLAVARDHQFLGIDGVVSNLTLKACSNTERFERDGTIGSATAVEILSIPEYWEKRLFSILDLASFQVAGGPGFDAEFIFGEDVLLIGENPFAIDYFGIDYLTNKRKSLGLLDRCKNEPLIFKFAQEVGVMNTRDIVLRDI